MPISVPSAALRISSVPSFVLLVKAVISPVSRSVEKPLSVTVPMTAQVVLCGEKAGSKLAKAKDLGVRVIEQPELLSILAEL